MDSWTLQGDSYSFLRSAPHTFSLRHRDGTPNHVEIFDIINVPSQRSVISETTCLCDIFGDDCESATLPSCPAVGAFVPPQREVGGSAAASPLVDDLNDSSGSYHTASSEGEEGFEDSRDKLNSPLLQSEVKEENSKDKRQPEGEGLSSGHKAVSEDSSPNLEPKGISPISQLSTACPSSEVGGRTPSPGHNSPSPLSPEETPSSFCSISGEKRCSPYSLNPQPAHSDAEPQKVTPAFKDTHNGPLQQSLTPVPSPEPNNFVSSSSTESVNNQSFPEFREAQVSPDPRSGCLNQHSSPSPETTSKDCSLDFTESAFESRISLSSPSPVSSSTELISKSRESLVTPEPTSKDFSHNLTESAFESRANLPSPLPLSSSTELLFKSRETPVSLELNNRPSSPDTQASSPFPELRSRVSLPDLFSRGSTPDIEEPPHTPELISNPSTAGRDTTDTPESQDTRLSAEPVSTVSTPGPRYTPPSPVISIAASPELVESSASPEFAHTTAPSPGLLCAASPSGIRTPSPGPLNQYISTTSEITNQVSSPVVSYSLSPSPKVTSNCSPIEHSHTSPSPVIRITETSPEVSRKDWSSEVEPSASPPLEDHFITASSRSPTSSPHITGVSYSVIQPEDRNTPPLPELSRLSTPEPDRTLVSPEARSPTPSRESIQSNTALTGAQRDSPLITGLTSSALLPDITLSHQPRYQAPSPQPKHHTPSPQPRNKTPSSDNYQSSSPQYRSKDPSPAAPSPEQRYHQPSPSNLSTEYNSQYTHPTPPLSNTPEGDSSAINNTTSQCPTYLTKKREAVPKEAIIMDNFSFTSFKEKQNTAPTFFQIEDTYNNPPIDIKSPSPDFLVLKDRNPNISLVHRATSNSPVQTPENPQPTLTTYSPTSESSSPFKSSEHTRSKHSTSVRRENRERFTEDMAHNVNRRRTPSPPLTRFTPVHILAPEKPYRQWQNRSRSPSQSVASLQSGNLKKVVTNRESPDVEPVDNNSEAHWVRLGTQLEMEREMQLEEDREVGQERKSDRVMERERKREERVPEKGRGWQGDTSYRGEQVDLSFTARNRKGPASRREAPTSREPREGLPTAHSYSESLLATRQLQQQQSLLRLASQQDPRVGGPNRRPQPPALQSKNRAPGRVPANRPCRSSSSSMGSELDETDNEVKWLTDSSFLSLSSPEVDYLDIYNSSHRSSTNISQPSPQESPAGVNAAWLAYADFRGSAPKLDNDELSFLQPSAYYSDGLDPMRRYEMGSFECVDVAVEREDSRKVRKGVPKRQILLKRKNNADGNQDESSENSSPGVPMMEESPSIERHSGEIFVRQQSLPVAMQDCYPREHSPEPLQQNDRKSKLQKSASLDETGHKTKMASCLIKNVLSKRMQSFDKQEEEVNPTFEENLQTTETAVAPLEDSPKPDAHNLSSSCQSADPSTKDKAKPLKNVGVRSSNRPSSSSSSRSINLSQSESEEAYSQSRNATSLRDEKRSELKEPFDSKQLRTGIQQAGDRKTWDEREGGDSANATAGKTAPSVTGASSMQARATNKDQECENTEEHKQLQQSDKVPCSLKTKEIPLKAVEKKKASLNVCLTPEAENRLEGFSPNLSFREKEEKKEPTVHQKTEEEEGNGNNQVKGPIHKVRDVRRLVKNTYNLSFKATSAVTPSNVNEERMEHFIKERGEGTKEESKEDTIAREERDVRQDIRREERREKMEEEFRMERKKVQKEDKVKDSKLLTLSSPLQNKGNPSFRSQPMQIQYKAVCCLKEDKNKTLLRKKDSEDTGLSPKVSQNLVTEVSRESSNAKQQNHTTRDKAIAKPYQDDLNMAVETQETAKEMHQVPDNDDKPVVFRTDKKPPMLGSLPKLPSKEREVSTAVVLIKDGSSKTKSSESRAQEESPNPLLAPAASASPRPITPGSTPDSSGHSVSTLLKEKGYQADIGAVVGDNQNVGGGKGVLHKHVNCLEIPLQTTTSSDGGWAEPHRERTFSSSSTITGATTVSESTDALTREEERGSTKPTVKDTAKQIHASPLTNMQEKTPPPTKQMEPGDFEAVKRLDPTFPPRSPAVRRFRPQPIEVKSLSTETKKQEIPTNSTGNNRSQTIEVKSIAKNSQKPAVPPKPSCKFVPANLGTMPNEAQRPSVTTSTTKPQGEERPQTIVVSSPTIYRKISNESTSASNYTRKLAVSAVSSLKPPPCKTTATTISNLSNQSTAPSETETSNDRGLQQKPGASPQSSSYTHKPIILGAAPSSATGPGFTTAPRPDSDPNAKQISTPASAGANQPSQPAAMPSDSHPQYSRTAHPNDQPLPVTSNNTIRSAAISTTQAPGYTHQPFHRSLSSERSQRTDDLRFYASDDPPSYDERESFSPLMLPDLAPRRSNRYQNTSRPPPCSCTAGCPSHPGLTPPHHYRSPHNLTPPAAPHSPGQALPYPGAQPPLRPHQCRPDPQPMSYQRGSPKATPLGPSQPPSIYQPLHQPPTCPPHPSLMQACPADRQLQPPQHIDPRRPPVHRSPQQQLPGMAGAPYSDPGHGHSPGLPPMDPQYMCGPQSLGPSYGSEYGGDTTSLYSESSYGQAPRRVLLDPETGKYFYIEVPVQPLRKMLFDPETGQYVEVLIPQQAMSHSGMYPPSAAPYPSLHNPNMYAPASQYMPYAAPPPQAHPQAQPQPPRYQDGSATAAMHPSGPGVSYRNPSGQGSKPEPQNHPQLDQGYLESMYYVPTGMNASPNPTPPDYYHKHPPNLPPTGGKRS